MRRSLTLLVALITTALFTSTPATAFAQAEGDMMPHSTTTGNIWTGMMLVNFGNDESPPRVVLLDSKNITNETLTSATALAGVEKNGLWEFRIPSDRNIMFESVWVDVPNRTAFATSNLVRDEHAQLKFDISKMIDAEGNPWSLCGDGVCGDTYAVDMNRVGCHGSDDDCATFLAHLVDEGYLQKQ